MSLLFTLLFLLIAFEVRAATYWVSPSGNNGNPCTNTTTPQTTGAKLTIAAGIACMSGQDTLNIRGGTYVESIQFSQLTGKSGNGFAVLPTDMTYLWGVQGTPTTIQGYQSEQVIINGRINASNDTASYILFKNLIVDGTGTSGGTFTINFGGGVGSVHHIKFDNVEAKNANYLGGNSGGDGIFTIGDSGLQHHIWYTNGKVHDQIGCVTDNGANDSAHGFYMGGLNSSSQNIIEYTEIYNIAGSGIEQFNVPGAFSGDVYRFNYIHHTGLNKGSVNNQTCNPHGESAIDVLDSDGTTRVYGNLMINNQNGLHMGDGSIAYNNTLWNNGKTVPCPGGCYSAIFADNLALAGTIRNNITFGNAIDGVLDTATYAPLSGPNISFNTTLNPNFVNTSNLTCTGTDCPGFHINAGPALDTGTRTITGSISIPACGVPLCYTGANPDLGAYESGVTATVAITSPPDGITIASSTQAFSGTVSPSGTAVTWSNNRGGLGSMNVSGTTWNTNSPSAPIPLFPGANIITVTAGTAMATRTLTYAPTFPGNTLAGAWGFEAGTGTTAIDSSLNNNTGILMGGTTWSVGGGKFGNALSFNSASQQFVNVANAASLQFTQSFTISAWVKPASTLTTFKAVAAKGDTQYLYASIEGYCGSSGILGGFVSNGTVGPTFDACNSTPIPAPGVWTHLVVTYNGPSGNLILYKNGVPVTTVPASGYMDSGTASLTIAETPYGEYFDGVIDEVRVYNFAIPITAGANTSPGASCGFTSQADRTNMALVSVVGDMNCPVIHQPITGPILKIPAGVTGLKLSSTLKVSQ